MVLPREEPAGSCMLPLEPFSVMSRPAKHARMRSYLAGEAEHTTQQQQQQQRNTTQHNKRVFTTLTKTPLPIGNIGIDLSQALLDAHAMASHIYPCSFNSPPPHPSPSPPPQLCLLPTLSCLCTRRHYRIARRALQQNGAEALRALPSLPSLVHSTRSGSRKDDEQDIPSPAPAAPPLPPTRLPPRPQPRDIDLDEEEEEDFSRCSMRFLREGDTGRYAVSADDEVPARVAANDDASGEQENGDEVRPVRGSTFSLFSSPFHAKNSGRGRDGAWLGAEERCRLRFLVGLASTPGAVDAADSPPPATAGGLAASRWRVAVPVCPRDSIERTAAVGR